MVSPTEKKEWWRKGEKETNLINDINAWGCKIKENTPEAKRKENQEQGEKSGHITRKSGPPNKGNRAHSFNPFLFLASKAALSRNQCKIKTDPCIFYFRVAKG